jgi:hypothetical protein
MRDGGAASRYAAATVAPGTHAPTRVTLAEFLVWDPRDPTGRTRQSIDGEKARRPRLSLLHAANSWMVRPRAP